MKKRLLAIVALLVLATLAFTACDDPTPTPTNYTVTFDSNGGTEVAPLTVEEGKTATEPEAPTKEGHNFCGWYLGEAAYDFATAVTGNITLVAQWEEIVYTTLVLDPSEENYTVQQGPQSMRIGSFDIILSSEKSRIEKKNVDFTVDGDYITHDTRINFNGSATMTPATSTSGEWENAVKFTTSGKGTVTIYWMHAGKGSNGDDSAGAWRNVGLWDAEGNLIAQSEGQHDYEATLVTTFEFDKAGTYYVGNIAHANYFFYVEVVHEGEEVELDPLPSYTVTFNSNEGTAVDPVTVVAGSFFKKPTSPTRDGYAFDAWYKDADLTEKFDFASDKITTDTTLYAGWTKLEAGAEVTYTFDPASQLADIGEGAKADGETEVIGNYFTIHYSAKTKIESKNKTFDDEYKGTRRVNFGNKATVGDTTMNCIEITTKGTATVKIWWASGADGREMIILDANGNEVAKTAVGSAKDDPYVSELTLANAGTYFIGGDVGKNYIFKIEVTVTEE